MWETFFNPIRKKKKNPVKAQKQKWLGQQNHKKELSQKHQHKYIMSQTEIIFTVRRRGKIQLSQ